MIRNIFKRCQFTIISCQRCILCSLIGEKNIIIRIIKVVTTWGEPGSTLHPLLKHTLTFIFFRLAIIFSTHKTWRLYSFDSVYTINIFLSRDLILFSLHWKNGDKFKITGAPSNLLPHTSATTLLGMLLWSIENQTSAIGITLSMSNLTCMWSWTKN